MEKTILRLRVEIRGEVCLCLAKPPWWTILVVEGWLLDSGRIKTSMKNWTSLYNNARGIWKLLGKMSSEDVRRFLEVKDNIMPAGQETWRMTLARENSPHALAGLAKGPYNKDVLLSHWLCYNWTPFTASLYPLTHIPKYIKWILTIPWLTDILERSGKVDLSNIWADVEKSTVTESKRQMHLTVREDRAGDRSISHKV